MKADRVLAETRSLCRLTAGATLSTALLLGVSGQARATEGGASLYLLGSGGPGAAELPPLKGVYFDNTIYYYSGGAGGAKQFPVGGNLVAGLDVDIVADFPAVVWVPTTNLAGGVLAIGAAVPFGYPSADVSAVITGPFGQQHGVHASDSAFVVGDPIANASWGWKRGKLHVAASGVINIPIGEYREDELANLAFHRWAGDMSGALTWRDEESGWDLSAKAGFTFNGTNNYTHYSSGTELHLEGAIEKRVAPKWTVGAQAYYLQQITDDGGAGATLGPFRGRVAGVGATASYSFKMGKMPATLRVRGMTEFDAKNRLDGSSLWLEIAVPLSVQLPKAHP